VPIAAVAVAVAVLLLLGTVPVRQHFTLREAAIYDPNVTCSPGVGPTKGTTVDFHWSAPSKITFFTISCKLNEVVYSAEGTNGSGSFVSVGGFYQFGASCPEGACVEANVTGTLTAPLLVL